MNHSRRDKRLWKWHDPFIKALESLKQEMIGLMTVQEFWLVINCISKPNYDVSAVRTPDKIRIIQLAKRLSKQQQRAVLRRHA